MHLTNVLEGCISQYSKFLFILWNIVCVLDLHLCFTVFSTWWENPSVFHLHSLIPKKPPFQLYLNTLTYCISYSFVCLFERDNIEHLCGEILNQSSDASEVQPPKDSISIEERLDDIDIMLRERLPVLSAASKESDFIMEQVLSKVNMGLIAFGYL